MINLAEPSAEMASARREGTPVVAHHTRDMDHSSPAAADGHQAAWIRHPLDPLDAGEIKRAVEILRREQPLSPDARFVSVSLNEPPKDQVALATPEYGTRTGHRYG